MYVCVMNQVVVSMVAVQLVAFFRHSGRTNELLPLQPDGVPGPISRVIHTIIITIVIVIVILLVLLVCGSQSHIDNVAHIQLTRGHRRRFLIAALVLALHPGAHEAIVVRGYAQQGAQIRRARLSPENIPYIHTYIY